MENLSGALKQVSKAVDLDTNGFHQAAFSKYIQSLQVLVFYLSSLFTSSGFQKMIENKKEVMQVLSMIHECSDRISVILNDHGKPVNSPKLSKYRKASSTFHSSTSKISAFEKVQQENMQLLKLYKMRLEKATDKYTRTNLTLEFQRRLAENAILARNKYDLAVKQLQKERVQLMEKAMRKLFENNEHLNEKEKGKRQLYDNVLQYIKTEVWPSSWKVNSYDLTSLEIGEKVFCKIIRCCEHPLTQWLILVQTNIKRKVDAILKEYNLNTEPKQKYSVEENDEEIILKCQQSIVIPSKKILSLEDTLRAISSEIRNIIEDTLQIFYLTYKSLLPEECEAICYQIIESYFLAPFWLNLFTLFRILNIPSEYKISESMHLHRHCTPAEFGIVSHLKNTDEFYRNVVTLLKTILQHQSLINKLKVLVHVSQKICEGDTVKDNSQRKLGTDEMIPVLCYIIVKSETPELISECHMLECLFDMRYMLGEEGYALSSFLTALKCIEIKKLTEYNCAQETM